ncbi:MAG: glycosyltransferase family 4 protein [bacterium]
MKVLVYTTLFPNHHQPNNNIFIKKRMFHFAQLRNCEIKVVAPIPYCPPLPVFGKKYQYSQIKKYELMNNIEVFHPRYPLVPKISMPFHGFAMYLSTIGLIKKISKVFPFDLIDGHYIFPDGLAALLCSKCINRPLVLSARGSDINQFTRFKSIKPMIRYTLNQADHVISVCNALKQEMTDLGIDEKKISVIPNGVDIDIFYPIDKEEARRKLLINQDHKVIVSVGSLIPRKGFHIILETLPGLIQRDAKIHLYIIGEGHYRSSLEKQIKDLHLDRHVTLVGEVANDELKFWYSSADVFCLASSREGWANVIMESLACGTPVVATRVYGAPEIITSAAVGILVDSTPQSLSEGLKTALETAWNRESIHAHVKNRTWFTVADEVKSIFDMVLSR